MQTEAVLRRSILFLVWPAALEYFLQLTVGLVNLGMVGRLGAAALGAVGLANRLTQIVWALFLTFSTGAVIRVAQAVGAGNCRAARHTAEQALTGGVVFVLLLALGLIARPAALFGLFGPSPEVIAAGTPYLRLLALGMPLFALMLAVGATLRGTGDTRTPMLVALLVNVVNVCGNYVLIFGRLGFPALGLVGSALATVFAQAVGAAVALFYLASSRSRVRVSLAGLFRVDWREIGDTFFLGLPAALEVLAWQIAAVILTGVIITYGTAALAGYQVGLTIEGLSYMPANAFYIAATALVGQALGAGDRLLARRYVREISRWNLAFTGSVALLLFFLPGTLVSPLTSDPGVVAVAVLYLQFMAFLQLPQNVAGVLNGTLRGAARTREPLIAMAVGLWGIRLPLALYFTKVLHTGLSGIWIAIAFDLTARLALSFTFYRRLHPTLPAPSCDAAAVSGGE